MEMRIDYVTAEAAVVMKDLLRKYPSGHPCLHQAVMCATDRRIWVAQAIDDRESSAAGAQNQQFYQYDLLELLRL